ncbi:hypothetical protein HPB47_008054 [Ixodes persulcatus]|uniref:Uncharacterized protein n=1 Tax=Ixodes persulcatus TaxID=34615 RepID=A0AC60P605_IXOPE|nr:hypothetical protein HPB47_008054 [Ixodes persulcatus]
MTSTVSRNHGKFGRFSDHPPNARSRVPYQRKTHKIRFDAERKRSRKQRLKSGKRGAFRECRLAPGPPRSHPPHGGDLAGVTRIHSPSRQRAWSSRQAQVSIQSARLTPGGHILEIRGRDAHTQHSTGAGRLLDEGRPSWDGSGSFVVAEQVWRSPANFSGDLAAGDGDRGAPCPPRMRGSLPLITRKQVAGRPRHPTSPGSCRRCQGGQRRNCRSPPALPPAFLQGSPRRQAQNQAAGQPPPTTTVSSGAPVRERRQLGTPGACQDVTDAPGSGTEIPASAPGKTETCIREGQKA